MTTQQCTGPNAAAVAPTIAGWNRSWTSSANSACDGGHGRKSPSRCAARRAAPSPFKAFTSSTGASSCGRGNRIGKRSRRHPEPVRSYQLGNTQESKTALLTLFRRVLKDSAPVHVIDTRAQADALIVTALEELQVLDICAEQGVRLTFFLFPTDDTESMT